MGLYFTQDVLFPSFQAGPTTLTAQVADTCSVEHLMWTAVNVTVVGAR